MSYKNRKPSELADEDNQESLRELCERLGIKMLPEDHPIFKEPPSIILNPFPINHSEEDEDQNSK